MNLKNEFENIIEIFFLLTNPPENQTYVLQNRLQKSNYKLEL